MKAACYQKEITEENRVILAHTGESLVQLGEKLWAVPVGTILG